MKPTQATPAVAAKPIAAPEAVAPVAVVEKHDLVALAPTPDLNPRNRAMKEIAERSNAQADVDAAESIPEMDEDGAAKAVEAAPAVPEAAPAPDSEPTEPAAEAPTEAPAEASPAEPQAAIPGIDPNGEYTFIVDGKEAKVKGSNVIARVQKGEVADFRLQEATRLLEEAKKHSQAVAAAQPPVAGAVAGAAPVQAPALTHEQLAEMVQFGTKEQAAQAIAEIEKRQKPAVTPEQLSKMVDHQLAFREATRFAQGEYGDLLSDPYLRQMFFWKEDQFRQAGDTRGYTELYKAIGDELRTHFNKPKPLGAASSPAPATPTKQAASAPTIAQRQAAKAAAPAAPRLAAVRLDGGAEPQKPKSREEVIEQMRKSRGQTSLNAR